MLMYILIHLLNLQAFPSPMVSFKTTTVACPSLRETIHCFLLLELQRL
jgi:hypothetical protein